MAGRPVRADSQVSFNMKMQQQEIARLKGDEALDQGHNWKFGIKITAARGCNNHDDQL